MRYKIDQKKFMYREEDEQTISLIVKETNKILFLNRTAAVLIKYANEVIDTKELLKYFEFPDDTENDIENQFINTIYLLHAYGIAEIEEKDKDNTLTIDIAGERDYYRIADFISANYNNPLNHIAVHSKEYYNVVTLRERQFNNFEYNIMKYLDGQIVAVLVVGVPVAGAKFSVIAINSLIFEQELDNDEVKEIAEELICFVENNFKDRFNKIRFYYYEGLRGFLKNISRNLGFELICTFKNEIDKKINVEVWDKEF